MRVLKKLNGSGWFVCFKLADLERVKGETVIFVGATKCAVKVDDNLKKRADANKRVLPFNSDSDTKRMKQSLDITAKENVQLQKTVLKLRTDPQVGFLQQRVATLEKIQKDLQSEIYSLRAEKKEMVKQATAMKSLLEQQGLGGDLDMLISAVVMSMDEDDEEKKAQEQVVKEGFSSEAVSTFISSVVSAAMLNYKK